MSDFGIRDDADIVRVLRAMEPPSPQYNVEWQYLFQNLPPPREPVSQHCIGGKGDLKWVLGQALHHTLVVPLAE